MPPTLLRHIPPGVPYIVDAEDRCYLLSDALKVPGSKAAGGFYDAPGSTERLLIRERSLTPQERYGLARKVPKTVAGFDPGDWR